MRAQLLLAASTLALQKVPLKRQGTATRRRLSVGGRTDLKTCEDNVFYAEASLGTPPQTFQLLIDTGSADLWVAATNCESASGANGGCPTTNLYDFEASSTAKGFGDVRVAIDYVDGELARGPALEDTFIFGGVTVKNMEFVAADQADFWACGQEDGVLGFGPRGASRVAAALMTPGATPSNRLGAQLDATQIGIWLDDSQLGDSYAGEVALGGADDERFDGQLAWLSRDDNAFWSAQLQEVTTLEGIKINSKGNALFDTGTTQLLAPKGHVVATLAALADAICYAEDPESPSRLCSADSPLFGQECSSDSDCDEFNEGLGECDAVPPLWIVKRCDELPEDGSETIDMAVADCDQGSRGLRFTFGDVSADLPANNLLSPQLHERRDFVDCDGVYWDRQYTSWSGDKQCDDGTFGPNFNCRAWNCDDDACDEPCDESVTEDPPEKCWIDVGASDSGDWVLGDPFLRAFYLALDFDEDKVGVAPSYPLGSHPARVVRKGEDAPADEDKDATCRDDPAFFYGSDPDNNCEHVAAKPSRCDDLDNSDGERTAREACAKTCGTCDEGQVPSCADDASWFYDGDEDRDCEHVAANAQSRCDADNTNDEGVTALEACRVTCGTCPTATPATGAPTPEEKKEEAQTPAPTPGPTYAPSPKPTSGAACVDDATWFYDGDEDRDCEHVGEQPESRCDDDNANGDGVTALQACRVTCGTCPEANEETPAPTAAPSSIVTEAPTGACHDSTSWFYSGDYWKTCAYVAQELKRCKDSNVNDDGISALEACPVTCDTCDAAPSQRPTVAPVIVDTGDDQFDDDDEPTGSPVADGCVDSDDWYAYEGNELQTCGAVAGNPDLCNFSDTAENCRKSCGTCGVFAETPRPSSSPSPVPTEDFEASSRDRSVSARGLPAMGWLLVFIIVGLVFAAVLCLVCRKRRSSARLNSEDDWQAQWSQVSGAQTPAGGAVELHQVGVRNPMADDREKGFSDVNLGV